jgi:Tol biopolymer transport system component
MVFCIPALLTALSGCTPSDPYAVWKQQQNDTYLFMSRADSEAGELYLLDKEAHITRLTNNTRHENNPALSPDGTRIAFHAGDENDLLSWEIYILDLETGTETRLTDNRVLDAHPDWSPDGKQIVFASFRDDQGNPAGTADIYVTHTDGTGLTQLTDSPAEDNDPEWSPDGTKIAFKSTRRTGESAREEIYIMNSDGSAVTRLSKTAGMQSDHDPSWSPDSRAVVFSRFEGSRPWTDIADIETLIDHWEELMPWNIIMVDMDGTERRLTDSDYICSLPVFSADGSLILYNDYELLFYNNRLIGMEHRPTLIGTGGDNRTSMLPDTRHTPALEYHDW